MGPFMFASYTHMFSFCKTEAYSLEGKVRLCDILCKETNIAKFNGSWKITGLNLEYRIYFMFSCCENIIETYVCNFQRDIIADKFGSGNGL